MAHSYGDQYPLPFQNEDQRVTISSYSSLANALGTDSGYVNQRRTSPLVHNIYTNQPPVSNPSYPYPASNVVNHGTYPARPSLTACNESWSRSAVAVRGESSDELHPTDLSWYDRLPQPSFMEPFQDGVLFPELRFRRKRNEQPYALLDLLNMVAAPDLMDGDSQVFTHSPERWIKIQVNWPGYSNYPFEKRIPNKRGTHFTRSLLLTVLARHVFEFVRWIQNEGAIVEPSQEHWAVTGVREAWKDCVIISLQHRTGSTWQPEIYFPRR